VGQRSSGGGRRRASGTQKDGAYIMVGDTFEDWRGRTGLSGIRPYETGDEVAKWRLIVTLRPIGDAVLVLHDYMTERSES
jgi:hypothetical protein